MSIPGCSTSFRFRLQCVFSLLQDASSSGLNEQQRDQAVEQLLQQHRISCEYYEDRTLFPLGSIRNQSQQPYQVFSAFKKKCYERLLIDVPSCYPDIEAQPKLQLDLSQFNFNLDKFSEAYRPVTANQYWPVEDKHAFELLNEFIAGRYAVTNSGQYGV